MQKGEKKIKKNIKAGDGIIFRKHRRKKSELKKCKNFKTSTLYTVLYVWGNILSGTEQQEQDFKPPFKSRKPNAYVQTIYFLCGLNSFLSE